MIILRLFNHSVNKKLLIWEYVLLEILREITSILLLHSYINRYKLIACKLDLQGARMLFCQSFVRIYVFTSNNNFSYYLGYLSTFLPFLVTVRFAFSLLRYCLS